MNNAVKYLGWAAAALCFLASCKGKSLETTYSSQEDNIDKFIENLMEQDTVKYVVHNGGSNRIVLEEGEGDELAEGGQVSFIYAGYTFSGSAPSAGNLFATNSVAIATESGWTVNDGDYRILTLTLDKNAGLVEGLRNGLLGVKGGEMCYIVFSGKYGFGDKNMGSIPKNSALIFQVWVESLTND